MTTAEKEKYKCLLPSLSGNQEVWLCMASFCVVIISSHFVYRLFPFYLTNLLLNPSHFWRMTLRSMMDRVQLSCWSCCSNRAAAPTEWVSLLSFCYSLETRPYELLLLQLWQIESYWTYEVCHGKHVRQYHEDKETGQVKSQVMMFAIKEHARSLYLYCSIHFIRNAYSNTQKFGIVKFWECFWKTSFMLTNAAFIL